MAIVIFGWYRRAISRKLVAIVRNSDATWRCILHPLIVIGTYCHPSTQREESVEENLVSKLLVNRSMWRHVLKWPVALSIHRYVRVKTGIDKLRRFGSILYINDQVKLLSSLSNTLLPSQSRV